MGSTITKRIRQSSSSKSNMLGDNSAAIGFPIRIVVLTVVGFAGLSFMLSAFFSPLSPALTINLPSGSMLEIERNKDLFDEVLEIEVLDPDGKPVEGVTVVVFGLGGVGTAETGLQGIARLSFKGTVEMGSEEGYLKMRASKEGYETYHDDLFLKAIRVD